MYSDQQMTRLALVVFGEEGKLSIAGQGTLKRVFLSAYLSENGQRILPPREHFYFTRDDRAKSDSRLMAKVATYFILSEEAAARQIKRWETYLQDHAGQGGLKFGEFGSFTFDGQLDFVAETLLYYQLLPEVPFKSVGAALHGYPRPQVHPIPDPIPVPVRRKILVPALWIVLVMLFGFAFYLWSGPLDAWIDQQSEMDTRLVNVAPKSYSIDSSPDMYNDTDEANYGMPDTETGVADPVANLENADNYYPGSADHQEELADVDLSNSAKIAPAPQSRCTLIVGAFAEQNNVERMVERLGKMGIEVITMERQTLTLVGAEVMCSDASRVNTLRDEIDPNAWIYKK